MAILLLILGLLKFAAVIVVWGILTVIVVLALGFGSTVLFLAPGVVMAIVYQLYKYIQRRYMKPTSYVERLRITAKRDAYNSVNDGVC